MRRFRTTAFLAGAFLLAGLAAASAQGWGRPEMPRSGACFYEHPNFGGRYFCAEVGAATRMVPEGMNDKVSSIRVFGDAEVTVFKDRDFRGDSKRFRRDRPDLREVGWNDRISSYRIDPREDRGREGDRRREMSWGRPSVPESGACFYEDPGFQGRYFCAAVGDAVDMVPPGMNDRISSIRVFGETEVTAFKDRDFQGEGRRFGRDMTDLRAAGFNDRISSFRVDPRDERGSFRREGARGREMSWGRPAAPESGACFYENPGFQGRYFCAAVGDAVDMVPPGMNDRISSIRVFGDTEVTAFKDRDFRGEGRRFGGDIADLRAAGFNDRISSFRVDGRGRFRPRH